MKITEKMIADLAKEYPGKKIICLPEKDPKEVICEIASAPDGSWSLAIALIVESTRHFHEKTWEVYRVLKGTVRMMDGMTKRGFVLTQNRNVEDFNWKSPGFESIWPGRHHSARAIGQSPAKVLVMASPAWNIHDHHLVTNA
jgi:mannose-6-phosphate isomerase-like protein (cupin superfamily)